MLIWNILANLLPQIYKDLGQIHNPMYVQQSRHVGVSQQLLDYGCRTSAFLRYLKVAIW